MKNEMERKGREIIIKREQQNKLKMRKRIREEGDDGGRDEIAIWMGELERKT